MSRDSSLSLRWLAGGLAALGLTIAAQAQCWENNFGSIHITGDSVTSPSAVTLPFSFPLPGGGSTTDIRINTNGYVWLDGTTTTNQSAGSVSGLLAGAPRIAVAWADLDCDPADRTFNGVYLNTSFANKAVITWFGNDWISSPLNNIQAQLTLFDTGGFIITHRLVEPYFGTSTSTLRDMVVGVSPGGGAIDPGEVDFTAGPIAGGGSTIYEFFPNPNVTAGDPRDIDTIPTLSFTPNVGGGYDVALQTCPFPPLPFATVVSRGAGCPAPVAGDDGLYERWAGGTTEPYDLTPPFTVLYTWDPVAAAYTVTLSSTVIFETAYATRIDTAYGWRSGDADDGLSNPIPIGFPYPAWGDVYNQVEVNPNGYVYFGDGGTCTSIYTFWSSTCFGGTRGVINAVGTDLDDSLGAVFPDGLYADTLPASGSLPQRFVVTWNNVPRFSSAPPSTEGVTTQVGLYPNGDAYATVLSNTITRSQSIAYFRGKQTANPGETDFSAGLPTTKTASVNDVKLASDAPILGSTPTATAFDLAPGTLGTVLHVGVDQTNTDLTFIGMPGCTGYTLTLAVILPMTPGGGGATASLGLIPANDPSIVGATLSLQAVSFVPGANALNLYASNGVDITAGL